MANQRMTKADLIKQWEDREKTSRYLWKDASSDIVSVLKTNNLKDAQAKLRGKARRRKAMAISGYYKSAADQVAKLRRQSKR